jgi:hypothetical protein
MRRRLDFLLTGVYTGGFLKDSSMAFDGDPLRGLFFLLVVLAVAAAGLIRLFAWSMIRGLMAGGWSTTQGRVEFGSVVEHRVRYVSYFVATIYYSYSVNNEYYSGNFERAFLGESAANRFVNSMKNHMIFVRSNPNDPEKSAILKQDQPAGWPA